jgi:hypothetical protein
MSVCPPAQKLSRCGIGSFSYTCTPDLTTVYRSLVIISNRKFSIDRYSKFYGIFFFIIDWYGKFSGEFFFHNKGKGMKRDKERIKRIKGIRKKEQDDEEPKKIEGN